MPQTLTTRIVVEVPLGGETLRFDQESSYQLVDDAKDDSQVTLAANAADGDVTLWSSAEGVVDVPNFIGILVDPEKLLGTDDVPLTIEITADGVVTAFRVTRAAPLLFGDSAAGGDITTIDGAITLIRARNDNATEAIGVRTLVLK